MRRRIAALGITGEMTYPFIIATLPAILVLILSIGWLQEKWLEWARALQAIAQTGVYFSEQRPDSTGTDGLPYHQIGKIAAEMIAAGSGENIGHISGLL